MRMYSAAFLLGREDSSPNETFYAQSIILNAIDNAELLRTTAGNSFDSLVRKDWRRLSQKSFLLIRPGNYVPDILRLCDAAHEGWPSAARIIRAAAPTVNLRLPASLLDKVNRIAEAQLNKE